MIYFYLVSFQGDFDTCIGRICFVRDPMKADNKNKKVNLDLYSIDKVPNDDGGTLPLKPKFLMEFFKNILVAT